MKTKIGFTLFLFGFFMFAGALSADAATVMPMTGSKWGLYASGGVIKCGVDTCGGKNAYPGTLPNNGGIYFNFPKAADVPVGSYVTGTSFAGTGLNDMTWTQWPSSVTGPVTYCAMVKQVNAYYDGAGWHDSLSWGKNGDCTNGGTLYLTNGMVVWLEGSVYLNYKSMTGHVLGDKWTVSYDYGTSSTDWRGYMMTVPPQKVFNNTQTLTMNVEVVTTGDPVFGYHSDGETGCSIPVSIRPHFQTGSWSRYPDDSARWWAKDPFNFVLANGSATISVPLQPQNWVQTWGKTGSSTSTLTAAFNKTIGNVGAIGVAMGGGCSYGHGTNISGDGASAQLILKSYSIN
jgi:hypothetical protein